MRIYSWRLLFVFGLILAAQYSFSQVRTLGTWKMYLPYHNSLGAVDAGDKVYDAAFQSVFSYEKSTGIIQTYDKASGLSDIGIKTINYDPATKFVAIAYTNSNLDFLYDGTTVYNIPDIKNQATTGAVGIYSISFLNGNAYVSSDLGISVVSLSQMQINSTYSIGPNGTQLSVYGTTFDSVNIYAATPLGVFYAPRNAPNLQDFNSWSVFGPAQGIPAKSASFVQAFNGKVYAVIPNHVAGMIDSIPHSINNDTLYSYNGTSWTPVFYAAADTITGIGIDNGNLYFSYWDSIQGNLAYLAKIDGSGNLTVNPTQGHIKPLSWFESNGVSWEPDWYNGLFMRVGGSVESIMPDGPGTGNVFALNCKNGELDVAPGGVDDSWGPDFNFDGFFVYKNGTWHNRNQYTDYGLSTYSDILCTASFPDLGKTYFGSFESGLIEMDENSGNLTLYSDSAPAGTLLQSAIGITDRTEVNCMYADSSDNLWMCNGGAPQLLKVIRADGTWRQFTVPYSISLMKKMVVDQSGQVWAVTRQTDGVLVFNYGQNMDSTSGLQFKLLQTGVGAGNLPSNTIFCITVDHTGNVWIGTDAGIGTFYCPGSVFNGGCDATQIKVTLNGYVGYLFGMQTVRALAVDAANRIWVGTTEGLWLISNDGQTTYLNFTTENSPLPNNQITDIAIDDATGEVFIGTDGGLVSYQGDAIGPSCTDCSTALVYPNPVRPDYTGPIAIKGLTDNAYVKITDISGTMIFQGRANGTQMIWNGNGYDGTRAKSGVYLVFSSTDAGKERRVAKILVSN